MEKVLHTGSKSRKVKRRQAKEEEHSAKKELDRPKNETPKAKTKTHSKLKRTKDVEHGITAGEGARSGEVTPKLSWAGRTSKAKRSKDSDDLDLQASIIVLEDSPQSGTNNLPRGISENGKSGDVDPSTTPKETPPVCHTPRGSSSGSEDDGSPTVFLCTQDEYVVGWDYGSPRPSVKPDYKSKRKGRRRKYKTKLFSPLQQNRRIIPKKAVSDDMSEAIRVFQEATKKIKSGELNVEASTDEAGVENSSWDSYGSTSIANSQQEKDKPLLQAKETVSNAKPSNNNNNNSKVSNLKHCYEIDGEDLIILLDDDDDECMVQCSQEVENNLKAVGPSDGIGNGDHKLNLPNSVLCKKSFKQKQENPFEENAKNIVKSNSITGSVGIGEIRSKSVSNNAVNKTPASTITSKKESDHSAKSFGDSKTESSNSKTEPVFDDSFDAILETFKDEDIELLSQGLEDKSDQNSKAEVSIDNSCNRQNRIIPNPSGAQGFVPKESSTYNKDKKLFQSNAFVNNRMPCSDKNSAIGSKKLPGTNHLGSLTKNCYNPKPQMEINSNRKEKPLSSRPLQQSNLTILDTICDSSENTSSSTQKCTPAEIERKRLEAMQRLEKKRKARALFGCANPVQLPKGPNR